MKQEADSKPFMTKILPPGNFKKADEFLRVGPSGRAG
jgi:hypothetical protein